MGNIQNKQKTEENEKIEPYQDYPLYSAVINNDVDCVEMLLEAGEEAPPVQYILEVTKTKNHILLKILLNLKNKLIETINIDDDIDDAQLIDSYDSYFE